MPYFVMEYVEGADLDQITATRRQLGTDERLQLFRKVCGRSPTRTRISSSIAI